MAPHASLAPAASAQHPPCPTPDGRYLVVRGRLWRKSNPHLTDAERQHWVNALMDARRAVKRALNNKDGLALTQARAAVHAAKVALGERGPVWWSDGARDYNRYLVKNTPYVAWFQGLEAVDCSDEVR